MSNPNAGIGSMGLQLAGLCGGIMLALILLGIGIKDFSIATTEASMALRSVGNSTSQFIILNQVPIYLAIGMLALVGVAFAAHKAFS